MFISVTNSNMVKFDEITEDNINDLSPEELREVALSGKTELMGARGVIGDLNKKIKNNSENNNAGEFNQEVFDQHYTKKQQEEKFNNFLSENNLDDEQKEQATDYFNKGLSPDEIAKLTGVTSFEQNQNNTNRMNVGLGDPGNKQLFENKLTYGDYSKLDKAGKDAYKSYSRQKHGGLSFERNTRND